MRIIDADWIKVAEELPPEIMDVLMTILHPDGEKEVTAGWHDALDAASTQAPTIDPSKLVKRGRWKYYHKQNKAVCSNCSFERDLDADFGRAVACPNCGAMMED